MQRCDLILACWNILVFGDSCTSSVSYEDFERLAGRWNGHS